MNHTRETPPPATDVDELWPSIRTRIDAKKVVPLPSDIETASAVSRRRVWQRSIAVLGVAAALVIAALALRNRRAVIDRPTVAVAADTGATFASLVDSVDVYEQEAKTLLDRLELQRAMLRPDAAQTLDHDLHVVDLAIGELKDAVARDPRNPALRQLLATSYRQKIDLLKRVGNAS